MDKERAQEDLTMIRRLMEDSRREVVDRGKHFVVWGVIGAVGSGLTYGIAVGWTALSAIWLWVGLMAVGWTASTSIGWRDARRARVTTAGRHLLSTVWVTSAITLTLVAVAGMFGSVLEVALLPAVLSVLLGGPVVATGVLADENWLKLVGVGWWVGGGIMLFAPGLYTLLLMAAMSFVLLAVPGGVLYARSRGTGSPEALPEVP